MLPADALELRHYQTSGGRVPFREWRESLSDHKAAAAIRARLRRLERGLFGDCKPVGDGVLEFRIDLGPGYRVYFFRSGRQVILLLCGGDKRTPGTSKTPGATGETMSKGRVAPSVPAEPYLRKQIRDPAFAAAYLSYCAESDDPSDFIFALREVAEAYGGIGRIAQRAKLSRSQLYKTLSRSGNPEFRTLRAILEAAGFLLTVVPKGKLKVRKSRPKAVQNQKSGPRSAGKSANAIQAQYASAIQSRRISAAAK